MEQGNTPARKRLEIIDFLRGITVISMLAYHLMWDVVYAFGHDISWYKNFPGRAWQQSICISFIFISGFCISLDKRLIKNALILLAASIVITIVTAIMGKTYAIYFGIIWCIGMLKLIAIPLTALYKRLLPDTYSLVSRLVHILMLIISLGLFILTKKISNGILFSVGENAFYIVPDDLTRNYITTMLGLPYEGFYSADYFPIIPWVFLFVAGCHAYNIYKSIASDTNALYPDSFMKSSYPLRQIGKNSLIIYLAHQPVIMAILSLLNLVKII